MSNSYATGVGTPRRGARAIRAMVDHRRTVEGRDSSASCRSYLLELVFRLSRAVNDPLPLGRGSVRARFVSTDPLCRTASFPLSLEGEGVETYGTSGSALGTGPGYGVCQARALRSYRVRGALGRSRRDPVQGSEAGWPGRCRSPTAPATAHCRADRPYPPEASFALAGRIGVPHDGAGLSTRPFWPRLRHRLPRRPMRHRRRARVERARGREQTGKRQP
jgi:hypothetical protein